MESNFRLITDHLLRGEDPDKAVRDQCYYDPETRYQIRPCCEDHQLKWCWVFASVTATILFACLFISYWIFKKGIISANDYFNKIIHLTIFLTLFSKYFIDAHSHF